MTRQRLRRSKGSNRRWALGVDRASSLLGRRCTPSWCAVSMNLAGCSVGPRRRCGERTPFAGDLRGRRNLGGYHRRDYRRLTPRCGARPFAFWVGWGPKSEPGSHRAFRRNVARRSSRPAPTPPCGIRCTPMPCFCLSAHRCCSARTEDCWAWCCSYRYWRLACWARRPCSWTDRPVIAITPPTSASAYCPVSGDTRGAESNKRASLA